MFKCLLKQIFKVACFSCLYPALSPFFKMLHSIYILTYIFQCTTSSIYVFLHLLPMNTKPPQPHPNLPQWGCPGQCFQVWPRCSCPSPTVEAGSSRWWWWRIAPLNCSCCPHLWPRFPWWCRSSDYIKTTQSREIMRREDPFMACSLVTNYFDAVMITASSQTDKRSDSRSHRFQQAIHFPRFCAGSNKLEATFG